MDSFLLKMAELLEVDTVLPSDDFTTFEAWDSLTRLSIIAVCDELYGVSISANDIAEAKTIEGLYTLILSKK